MEAIKLESNVGLCGLRISASPKRNEILKLLPKFLGFWLWHDGASAVFGGGKKAKFSRDSAYSDELGNHAKTVLGEMLGKFCENVEIETFAHVKQSEEQKFLTFCKKLGMSETEAKAGWESAQKAKAAATPAEPEKVQE